MTPKNTNPRSRARRFATAAAVVGVLDGSPALAQAPVADASIWAHYNGLDPKGTFAFKMDDQRYTKSVGALRWDVPRERLTAAGFDRTFTAFCAEPLVGVTACTTYRFDVQDINSPVAYGLPDTPEGVEEAKLRGRYIRELFGRHYTSALDPLAPDNTRAFQAALWEVTYEKQLPLGPAAADKAFSLGTGTFQSDYPDAAQAPAFVRTAETYLSSLTGTNEAAFFNNDRFRGFELVRMNGLPNATGVVAQDQYAIRTEQVAAAGAGPGAGGPVLGGGLGGTGGSGIGGGGFGAPVGGFGGGYGGGSGGGGGGFISSPPSSSITSPPSPPPPQGTPPPPPFSPPPINSPPPGSPPQSPPPPGSPPPPPDSPPPPDVPPGNPVPAPPGLLLGGIAALALAGRRALARGKK